MRRLTLGVVALLVALLAFAQVVLPLIAERRVRSDLEPLGRVLSVDVRALPAGELLWGRADSVRVRLASTLFAVGGLADRLAETRGVAELDARADRSQLGTLALRDLRLRKSGDALTASATVTTADLEAAVPPGLGLRPVQTGDGSLVFEAEVGPVAVRARLSARDGALVVAPDGLLGGFATLTVFKDPRVRVLTVAAEPLSDGFRVVVRAVLT